MIITLTLFPSCSQDTKNKNDQSSEKKSLIATKAVPIKKNIVYIVSDTKIPFWTIMQRGVSKAANSLGYKLNTYNSNNNAKRELELMRRAIKNSVSGIIVSPTSSSACATLLKLAEDANIPVVISDIGTDGGEYVSFISSNNKSGGYAIGEVLVNKMQSLGIKDAKVGIVAIPQSRLNGQARTDGFIKAINKAGVKTVEIREQVTFSKEETYTLCKEMIQTHPNLHAIWLQGSDKYKAALRAIDDTHKTGDVLLVTFDAEPEFIDLISKGSIAGSAMQQPYLMGKGAVHAMDRHLNGKKVEKELQLPVLIVTQKNVDEKLRMIRINVLGIEES